MEPWLIVVIVVAVIALITILVIFYQKNKENKIYRKLAEVGEYNNGILNIEGIHFLVQLVRVNAKEEVTINSNSIIQVKGAARSRLLAIKASRLPRLIIIFPYDGRIKRYINENEMTFITYRDYFWQMYVCKVNDLAAFKDYIDNQKK